MLKSEIAQKVTEVKEQIRSFLRHGEGGPFSQKLAGKMGFGKGILLCSCLNSGISPKGLKSVSIQLL